MPISSRADPVEIARHSVRVAIVGAGPVGLALALLIARTLPQAAVHLFERRLLDQDVGNDARIVALSAGSLHLLRRILPGPVPGAQPIVEVDISQQPPSLAAGLERLIGEPNVQIRALDEAVPMLGAVAGYGRIVEVLQRAWAEASACGPQRLHGRFGTVVAALKHVAGGVEVDAGIAETFDLVVVAEGGVFADQARKPIRRDYRQNAWVGTVGLATGSRPGVAYERFTRHGPVALLPLPDRQASLVWCVDARDDPVVSLDDRQRLAVLNTIFPARTGGLDSISPLKSFPLGLNAERTVTDGRIVRIGNAAQTLHPVAGQGLNLGLRDAWELVRALQHEPDIDTALRRVEWRRAPDRWATIAATDFLARSFTWKLPGAGAARGLGLAALQAFGPARSALARQMMFGRR